MKNLPKPNSLKDFVDQYEGHLVDTHCQSVLLEHYATHEQDRMDGNIKYIFKGRKNWFGEFRILYTKFKIS